MIDELGLNSVQFCIRKRLAATPRTGEMAAGTEMVGDVGGAHTFNRMYV